MSREKGFNVTVNWKDRFGQRGLTELAIETLQKVGNLHKKPNLIKTAEDLQKEYHVLCGNKVFDFHSEVELIKKYIHVRM